MENLKYYLDYYFENEFKTIRSHYYESMITNYGDESLIIGVNKNEFERMSKLEGVIVFGENVLVYNKILVFITTTNNSNAFNNLSILTEYIAEIIAFYKNETFNKAYLEKFIKDSENIMTELIKKLKLKAFENKKRELADQIFYVNKNITRTKEQLVNYFNQLRMAQAVSYDGYLERASANLDKELLLIKNHKKVESISIEGDRFVINTVHLYITEPKSERRFSLGKMSIKMPLTSNLNIMLINNTTQRDGYWNRAMHPHVSDSGIPCLGNIEMGVVNYITEEQYYALFILLLNYLETVDIGDCAGKKILAWDEVDENNNVIIEGVPKKSWDGSSSTCSPISIDDDDEDIATCIDCGNEIDREELYICEICGARVCEDCVRRYDGMYLCNHCYENELENASQEDEDF